MSNTPAKRPAHRRALRTAYPTRIAMTAAIVLLTLAVGHAEEAARKADAPNVVMILVDDMGYSDIGCYGGEVRTPNIDRLARAGLRFTEMHNTSKCFPSRACLLTGVYAQQCNMGRNSSGGIQDAITLADLLGSVGYRTLAVGKHHSGVSLMERGFDHFHGFYYRKGGKSCANHFNPGQQRPGEGIPARKANESRVYCFDDQEITPYYTPKEKDWYTTDYFTKWAMDLLEEHRGEDRPYFLYLAYTAPHDPLHAWPEDIAKYEGVYDVGYEAIREARFRRQKEMGLVGADVRLSAATHRPWDSLNEEEKADQVRRMQVYAAMIDRVDQNVGDLLRKIEELGDADNTLILFASDNGCSAANVATGSGEIGSLTRWASVQRDWANVSNTPFRLWKDMSHEGGIRTPFIAYWPNVITARGSINRQPVHFVDVMATLREITGASYPSTHHGSPLTPMQGESLLPAFRSESLPDRREPLYWVWASGGAIRTGNWKLVTRSLKRASKDKASGNVAWELYDMSVNCTETDDLAKQHPELAERLGERWRAWYRDAYGLD